MKAFYNRIINRLNSYEFIQYYSDYISTKRNSTIFIHIGKCGGRTIRNSLHLSIKNFVDYEVHIRKPVYRKDLNYIIVARDPISRLLSAYKWRHKILINDGQQRNRIPGEYEILKKYNSLNQIAEVLYDNEKLNIDIERDLLKIHHIKENISFYLNNLLKKCHHKQIVSVLLQENLNNDIHKTFGIINQRYDNYNSRSQKSELSLRALNNLRSYLQNDYDLMSKLHAWGKIDSETFKKYINS